MLFAFLGSILLFTLIPFFIDVYTQNHQEHFITFYNGVKITWIESENLLKEEDIEYKKQIPEKYINKYYDPVLRNGMLLNLILSLIISIVAWVKMDYSIFLILIPLLLGDIIWWGRICLDEYLNIMDNDKYEIFQDIIDNLKKENEKEIKKANEWRKKHPLEEKIRLALTKNPNYIADLLKYCKLIKEDKNN